MTDVPESERTALAVWGSPIDHSLSPRLHLAAYETLGMPWSYGRRDVDGAAFASAWAQRDQSWRGISLTMPLKSLAFEHADSTDAASTLTAAANTLRITSTGVIGANTDVYGMIMALTDIGVSEIRSALIIGAGSTAASALVALAELGADRATVLARDIEKARALEGPARALGVDIDVRPLAQLNQLNAVSPDVIISTIPGAAQQSLVSDLDATSGVPLLDVSYDPWPSRFAERAVANGARVANGRDMLVHQALAQVRFFVSGDSTVRLPNEDDVLAAMFSAISYERQQP